MDTIERIDAIIARLKAASWKEREAIKDELLALCKAEASDAVTRHLESARGGLPLEVRWEVEEVLEALAPEPEPEPEPEEADQAEEEDDAPPDGRLRMSDLKEVYADPRGLSIYTDKKGVRWFLQQLDPYTGQPSLAEIPPGQIEGVKAQLKGSPYWTIGSGVAR